MRGCPRMARSRASRNGRQMSAFGAKRTSADRPKTSRMTLFRTWAGCSTPLRLALPKGKSGWLPCRMRSWSDMGRQGFFDALTSAIRALAAIWVHRAVVVAFLVTPFAWSAALAAEPKRVMVLHSFGREFKPWSEYAKAIRTELDRQSPWPLEIIEKSLVTARSDDDNPEVPFVEYLRALFANRPLDLIVSIGAPAANFVQRRRQQLFATTPMVFTAVEQRRIQRSSLTENDTVVAIAQNFPAIIENILHVLPDTKTVAVVIGNSPNERFWLEVLRKEFAPFANRISFIWYNDRSVAEILKHAAALPPHSAIYWHQMNVDAAGVANEGGKALPALYAVANAPIFAFNDAFFGGEIVGGPMNSVVESSPTDGRRCRPHPRRRQRGRHQDPTHRICNAEVRLAADAALGHQREQVAAGK